MVEKDEDRVFGVDMKGHAVKKVRDLEKGATARKGCHDDAHEEAEEAAKGYVDGDGPRE